MGDEQTFLGAVVVKFVELVIDLRAGDTNAEVIARDRFDRMAFVQDHGVVVRQQRDALAAQRQVAEEHRVIDDQQLGTRRSRRAWKVMALGEGFTAFCPGNCRYRWRLRPRRSAKA
jgi:hypothetical protein